MEKKKYTLYEFMGACESDDFDIVDEHWMEHYKTMMPTLLEQTIHDGDCTKQPISCPLCCLETLLADYREYYFNEEKWRKENL